MPQQLTIDAPAVFKPLEQPSRAKGLHGGRGSGKSWHAATVLVLRCLREPGIREAKRRRRSVIALRP
jgi:phage terminase large subunit